MPHGWIRCVTSVAAAEGRWRHGGGAERASGGRPRPCVQRVSSPRATTSRRVTTETTLVPPGEVVPWADGLPAAIPHRSRASQASCWTGRRSTRSTHRTRSSSGSSTTTCRRTSMPTQLARRDRRIGRPAHEPLTRRSQASAASRRRLHAGVLRQLLSPVLHRWHRHRPMGGRAAGTPAAAGQAEDGRRARSCSGARTAGRRPSGTTAASPVPATDRRRRNG